MLCNTPHCPGGREQGDVPGAVTGPRNEARPGRKGRGRPAARRGPRGVGVRQAASQVRGQARLRNRGAHGPVIWTVNVK